MKESMDLFTLLQNKPLTDIYLIGFVDQSENKKEFHPMLQNLYLEFEKQLLRCTSINQYDQLMMQFVDEITCDFDIDEDDDFCVCSVYEQYMKHPNNVNQVIGFWATLDTNSDLDKGIVKCIEFRFGANGSLFLDPMNLFGIRIGTEQQRNEWINDWKGWLTDSDGQDIVYKEYIWENPSILST